MPRQREGSNICVAIEENGDVTVQEEDSSVSNGDLLNAVNAFAGEYRTNTRGLLQEIEDIKLSNKKQAQALQEVGGKIDKYDAPRSNGPATDLSEENADRTEQTKEHREPSATPTKTIGDGCSSEVDPDLPQRPHRQPPRTRSTQPRRQSASPRRHGSRLRQDENMERSMSEEQDNRTNIPQGRTETTETMMRPFAHRSETLLESSYQEKCSFARTLQEEWMIKLRSFERNSSTITREKHETPNENLSHRARSDQCTCEKSNEDL